MLAWRIASTANAGRMEVDADRKSRGGVRVRLAISVSCDVEASRVIFNRCFLSDEFRARR